MATNEEMLQALDDALTDGVRRGVLHNDAQDEVLDGRVVTIDGRPLVNFGSCSYLGLEKHPAMKAGVIAAVSRYGTQFSSSRTYVSSPAYAEAEALLGSLFGRPAIITPSTTMGHVATMPTVIGEKDLLVLDHQVHHSVQVAAKLVKAQGSRVELIRHGDLDALDQLCRQHRRSAGRVWFAADGLYSMYADFLQVDRVNALMRRHDNLWLYLDDAHAAGWTGRHGRGYVLSHLAGVALERSVVALSLNKSFAAAGGVITFPTEEMRRRVFTCGGPLIFSGPVQPPMLGAVLASARLHLTEDVAARQRVLLERIRLFNRLAREHHLPLVSPSEAPIRCVGAGVTAVAYRLTARLRDAGIFVNTATFPAVAAKRSGARLTLTVHHSEDDVRAVVAALVEQLPRAMADEGAGIADLNRNFAGLLPWEVRLGEPSPADLPRQREELCGTVGSLVLESHDTIETVDPVEWDALLGGQGSFDVNGLRVLEHAFADAPEGEPENAWAFRYLLVRDRRTGRPVAATFFTTALWKDDMLSPVAISEQVEARREGDPYYLTSTMVGMGSLLTEGDHLYLDRTADWQAAMRLILTAARDEEDHAGAAAVVLRDLPDGDEPLHEFLVGAGFIRVPVRNTWTRAIDFADDGEFLDGLGSRARWQQRTNVLPHEGSFHVEVVTGGRADRTVDLDHLYSLYRNVHANNLELNVYPLPRRILDAIVATPGWELLVFRIEACQEPVGFVALHTAAEHVGPVFCGLDYDYVASHGTYQQVLWQSIRAGQRRGAARVKLGMAADLHKRRFGATLEPRWLYIQPTETFNMDVLLQFQTT